VAADTLERIGHEVRSLFAVPVLSVSEVMTPFNIGMTYL
jgi:hypothetical protein